MKALSQEYKYHIKIALAPLGVILWPLSVVYIVCLIIYGIIFTVLENRREKRAAQLEEAICTRDGDLSVLSITSDLEALETQVSQLLDGFRFLAAINALDSVEQMQAFYKLLDSIPEEGDCSHVIPANNESFYLLTLAQGCVRVRHKILYEYQRKNGSLKYKAGDKKPLLAQQELIRPLDKNEREPFVAFCMSIQYDTGAFAYDDEKRKFLEGSTDTSDVETL